jgi:hypothetical protein
VETWRTEEDQKSDEGVQTIWTGHLAVLCPNAQRTYLQNFDGGNRTRQVKRSDGGGYLSGWLGHYIPSVQSSESWIPVGLKRDGE